MNDFPFSFPLPDHDVQRLRARILTTLCAADEGFCAIPVASIRRQTLAQMLDLYDSLFFSGFLGRAYGEIDVTLSQRLTSSAGKFMYVRGGASRLSQAEIRMSGDFLFRLSEGPFRSTVCPSQRRRRLFSSSLNTSFATRRKTRSSVQPAILPAFSRSPTGCLATTIRATAFRRACRRPLWKGFPPACGFAFTIRAACCAESSPISEKRQRLWSKIEAAHTAIGRDGATANTAFRSDI